MCVLVSTKNSLIVNHAIINTEFRPSREGRVNPALSGRPNLAEAGFESLSDPLPTPGSAESRGVV
jgi:hypothetical protein